MMQIIFSKHKVLLKCKNEQKSENVRNKGEIYLGDDLLKTAEIPNDAGNILNVQSFFKIKNVYKKYQYS